MPFSDGDPRIGEVLLTESDIAARITELGHAISTDYAGRPPLMVCVLKGAFVFLTDLCRNIDLPVEVDFIAVSSYGNSTRTSGVVRLIKDLDVDIANRHVLLVEDIVDSGLTLRYLRRNLLARGPASLGVATLLARSSADLDTLDVRYVGFTIPDEEWVVGYGLDHAQELRNLPYLARYSRL